MSRVVLPAIGVGALGVAGAAGVTAGTTSSAADAPAQTLVAASSEPVVVSRGGERPTLETEAAAAQRVQARLWVVAPTQIRADAAPDAAVLGLLEPGQTVAATGVVEGEWAQIMHNDLPRWVPSAVLSDTEPPPEPEPAELAARPCPAGSAVERGLLPDTIAVYRAVCARWPGISDYGGTRGDGEHAAGRALDIMVSDATGTEIAEWLRAHAGDLGISEVIWRQRIWTTQRAGDGWRPMEDRGSATANHMDHVHVTTIGSATS